MGASVRREDMSDRVQMTQPHYVGDCSRFASFVSNRHGRFYVSYVALTQDEKIIAIGINGPYATEAKADYWCKRWTGLNDKALKRGNAVTIPDGADVPEGVRAYITSAVTEAIQTRGIKALEGTVFGRCLQ
jgi:hypothetical protein